MRSQYLTLHSITEFHVLDRPFLRQATTDRRNLTGRRTAEIVNSAVYFAFSREDIEY